MDFVSAETFSIDDSFKVGWTEGTDNYEAIYKVLRIETTPEGNVTTLLLMPPGIIGISNKKQGDTYTLGTNAKIHFDEVYVSGDDKWISISLENAQFKDESSSSGSEENEKPIFLRIVAKPASVYYNVNLPVAVVKKEKEKAG